MKNEKGFIEVLSCFVIGAIVIGIMPVLIIIIEIIF